MNINLEKLARTINELERNTRNACCESAVFIGEINDKPVRISIMSNDEAVESHDYEETLDKFNCIDL